MNMMTAVVKNVSIVDLAHTAVVPEAHTKIIVMDIQGSVDIVGLLLLELALEVLIKDTKSNRDRNKTRRQLTLYQYKTM